MGQRVGCVLVMNCYSYIEEDGRLILTPSA